ncbi:MAG TPA: peptidoglycan DD-metalloendopeptidase family protein [Nitrospiria bacterium]|nr:peptidoglycan DD-metalloendopeptidase family protein [Nitrospiria bacterium]
MGKKKETYTVMILPNPTSTIHRFCISKKSLKIAVCAVSIFTLLLIAFMFNYISMADRVWELNALRKEATSQRIYIQSFMKTMDDIKGQMERIKELDAKLRVITNLSPPAEQTKPSGMGGREETPVEEIEMETTSPLEAINQEENNLTVVNEELVKGMQEDLKRFSGEAEKQELSLSKLMEAIKEKQAKWASTPSIWPVNGGHVTSGFGLRISPFTEKISMHSGLDIAARPDTPVMAPAGGRVMFEGNDGGLGNAVKIDHGYGIQSIYGHLSRTNVKIGQRIKRGSIIGFVGSTGLSTGPHLHYEVIQNQRPVNPTRYILN